MKKVDAIFWMPALFLNQRTLKDRPGIKPCVIGPPKDTIGLHLFPQLEGE
jgi:hypothetical protein